MQLLRQNAAAALLVVMVMVMTVIAGASNVTYDGRSLIIDGERKMLFSGSIHYPRSTPDMWPSLISKAKQGGIDVIETYVFWNLHEHQPGQYDFSGRRDIVAFIKEIQAQGLYACLRIGPYIEAEWTYGGFPFWLHDVPGIVYRSDNEPFKFYMQNFTTKIVNLMKSEGLYASQGGPIILSQIENEYQNKERSFREKGPRYVRWAAKMAVELETGVPWIMCKQDDAPDPIINTCNGMSCGETFKGPNSPNKPSIWTENWTSFYQVYGEVARIRSAEELAFQVALFIARKNGTYINYYMYHGGTNFGRSAAEFMITGYYDQAPLDEYGLIRQPKWGHLKELHAAVKLCSEDILSAFPTMHSLGPLQEAYVFGGNSGTKCSAFLVNTDRSKKGVTVQFQNSTYQLPPKSISILPDCKTVAFNTAKVSTQFNTRTPSPVFKFDRAEKWEQFQEAIPQFDGTTVRSQTLLEQTNTTKDVSDYLWYTASLEQESEEQQAKLSVKSLGHVLHAFVNGRLVGYGHGQFRNSSFTVESTVPLNKGTNQISLLNAIVGLPNSGAFLERRSLGIRSVMIQADKSFTDFSWGYQVGLLGEKLQIYTSQGAKNANWSRLGSSKQQLTWYKSIFDAPKGDDPVTLNLGSMGKGEAWVNGQSIGRYWLSFHTSQGVPSQTWYNVPRSFLKPKDNVLVLFEEEIGNPLNITIDTISITKVCAHVTDSSPPPVNSWRKYGTSMDHSERHPGRRPKVHLSCPPRRKISEILFASFGNPTGDCDDYAMGLCHSPNSKAIVEKACLGKRKCTIVHSNTMKMSWSVAAALLVVMVVSAGGAKVSYDGRSLMIDGQRKMLFSGSIHYPRSTPNMWPSLISKAKQGGIDVIETYVFWNLHEPQPGQYDFSGRRDIVAFMKEIQAQGLYACLRIGPYIEGEWTYGGFPFWLHDVPGIVFRSNNEPFKFYMQNFTTKIVNLMKSEELYASQGGPIILSQIENEYQNVEKAFGEDGPPYVEWAAEMAVGLQTGVPWCMCKQDDAPDPVINSCNGLRCGETFKGPNSPNKPSIWTENWTSFYQVYGQNATLRSAEDMAYHVALFIARKNGTFINYYMYHGGTNFGRTAAEYMITSYYDQAPLDEYGLIRQPKWGHLKELHEAVKLCSETILSVCPSMQSLGEQQEAYVFSGDSGACAAFLVNIDSRKSVVVQFQNSSYELPRQSISILPDCKTIAFNTAKVSTQFNTRTAIPTIKFDAAEKWEQFEEVIPQFDDTSLRSDVLLEHMNTTKDVSDYLWYTSSIQQDAMEQQSTLSVKSLGHVLHAFVNGEHVGSSHGRFRNTAFTLEGTVSLNKGTNNISLLSATVGLPDSGSFLERRALGVESVIIQDSKEAKNITNFSWGYQVGLLGEKLQIYSLEESKSANWSSLGSSQPLTWYKSVFDAPKGDDPVALNLGSMGKGEAWVNGQSIGRYWVSFLTLAGIPSQTWYNVPRSFLQPGDNLLVLFEEETGNPLDITIDTISVTKPSLRKLV